MNTPSTPTGRFRWLKTGLLLLTFVTLLQFQTTLHAAGERPNIVLIMVDDLGYGDNRLTNTSSTVNTPHIKSIADNGINFTQAYVAAPACSPSRASLLTGIYPNRFGADNNSTSRHRPHLMPATTIASLLEGAAGEDYRTGVIGKWDLAGRAPHATAYLPIARGFGLFYGIKSGISSYYPKSGSSHNLWYWDHGAGTVVNPTAYTPLNINQSQNITRFISPDYVDEDPDNFLTNKFRKEAIDFINDYQGPTDDPFFLFLSLNAPHKPYMAPNSYYQAATGSGEERLYNAMVANIDDNVGLILDELDQLGIIDDTLVIFVSDNGAVGAGSSGGLTGGKNSLFEGGIHTSWAMQWPAKYGTTPQVYDEPVITLDILATLAAAAGSSYDTDELTDGQDLTPYLTGAQSGAPHANLFWRYIGDKDRTSMLAVRSGDYKYLVEIDEDGDRTEHLYDLASSLAETSGNNLVANPSYTTTRNTLVALLNDWNLANPLEEDFDNADYDDDEAVHGFVTYLNTSTAANAWMPANDAYKITDGRAGDRAIAEMTYFEDAFFECDMKLVNNGKAALIFRSTDHVYGSLGFTGYYAQIAAGSDTVALFRVDNGTKTQLASATHTIDTGVSYYVKVLANGSSLQVFVDDPDNPVISTTDATYDGGSVGLRLGTPSGSATTTAIFDDLIVTPIVP